MSAVEVWLNCTFSELHSTLMVQRKASVRKELLNFLVYASTAEGNSIIYLFLQVFHNPSSQEIGRFFPTTFRLNVHQVKKRQLNIRSCDFSYTEIETQKNKIQMNWTMKQGQINVQSQNSKKFPTDIQRNSIHNNKYTDGEEGIINSTIKLQSSSCRWLPSEEWGGNCITINAKSMFKNINILLADRLTPLSQLLWHYKTRYTYCIKIPSQT